MTELTKDGALALPEGDEVTQALAEISKKNATITTLAGRGRELHEQFKDVAFDVASTAGMEAAKAARHQIRTDARYPMQKLRDEGSKMLGQMQRQFNARAGELIAEVENYEKPIDEQITAEEQRKADAKAKAAEEERMRVEAITQAIDAVRNTPLRLVSATAAELESAIAELRAEADEANEEDFAEFAPQAKRTYVEALEQLGAMHVAKKASEEQAAELARQQAAQAEQQRLMDEQAAAMRQQQEALAAQQRELAEAQARADAAKAQRMESIKRRVGEMRALPETLTGTPSAFIEQHLRTLNDTLILPGDYEQFIDDATSARAEAIEGLRDLLAKTIAMERRAAAEAEASQVAAAAQAEADRVAREAERVAQEQARAEQARAQAAEQVARERAEAAERAVIEAEARVQALAKKILALLCQGVSLMPVTDETAEWLSNARAVVAEANGTPYDDPAVADAVLTVISYVFSIGEGEYVRALRLKEDLAVTTAEGSTLIEELGIRLNREIPLVLAAQIAGAKTVQDIITLMGGK